MRADIPKGLLDSMCRTASATLEMFEYAARVEITTNVLTEGQYAGAIIVSATRTENGGDPIVGVESRDSEIFKWNKDASDERMFG